MTDDLRKTISIGILLLGVALLSSACASGYHRRAQAAYDALNRGDAKKAVELIEKAKPGNRDKLLYLLDKGMILHAAGEYAESNKVLTEAEDLSDALTAKSVSKEVASTLWSEEATDYAGDNHERMLIVVVRMLNYIMLDEWKEALVEVRRLHYLAEKVYGSSRKLGNNFATYLSAIVWEALGHLNDAYIDYKRLSNANANVPYYAVDMKDVGKRLGLDAKLPKEGDIAWTSSEDYRKKKGEVVVIIGVGRAPYYVSEPVSTGYYSVSMPSIRMYRVPFNSAKVVIDGRTVGQTYPFYNVIDDVEVAVKKRRKRAFVKKLVKTSVQTGLVAAGSEMVSEGDSKEQAIGFGLALLGLSMAAAEKADERSWRTLPAQYQLGRFYVTPGQHTVEITPSSGAAQLMRRIDVGSKKPSVILFEVREGVATSYSAASELAQKKLGEFNLQETQLRNRIDEDPSNGNLKLDLAELRLRNGNYNVEQLVIDALRQGANEERACFMIAVSSAVKGLFNSMRDWSNKGGALKGENANMFKMYSNAASYLLGDGGNVDILRSFAHKDPYWMAFNRFVTGLIYEKKNKWADAARAFALAYDEGLIGEPVAKKVMAAYEKADDQFKKSDEGIDIAVKFADEYLENR